jgi:hypothetical protein
LNARRTVATTALVLVGLALIVLVEATGKQRARWVVSLCTLLLALYAVVIAFPVGRRLFTLAVPLPQMMVVATVGSLMALASLWLIGDRFRLRRSDAPAH